MAPLLQLCPCHGAQVYGNSAKRSEMDLIKMQLINPTVMSRA